MSITRQKFCYLVVLNKKFLTLLASDLLLQIEQVLSQIGIVLLHNFKILCKDHKLQLKPFCRHAKIVF
ncbi:hypothetical protein F9Y84_16425 [Pseudoalteromonas peptidolytica]|nr:hypothetical protein [Pseudoalteromonas peptidolytica]